VKLILGTVQFGLSYGINNNKGIPDDKEISNILKLAKKESITNLDTSISYGNSEERIAKLSLSDFKLITKTSEVKSKNQLLKSIKNSLKNLKKPKVYGYLFHNADNLIENPDLWETMLLIKNKKLVEKIGFSIYTTKQLDKLLENKINADIVQLPYSLLDRKFEKYFMKLKKLGTEIHVRSVFLQGLYFMDNKNLPQKLLPLKKNLIDIENICDKFNVSIGELALNFVYENKFIDKIIIGVDSSNQLNQNIKMIKNWNSNNNINRLIDKITVKEQHLLSPVNW